MTDFENKRLNFLIKSADKGDWVQLAKGDGDILKSLIQIKEQNDEHYNAGFIDGENHGITLKLVNLDDNNTEEFVDYIDKY